ncbi:Hypothetical predicted protein [Cloeon dipterum]|uniref:BZIP domain-containing protein n=1 Tax=Cloeon dipterum TaxID=197152 RepID=A0A8S1DLN7_9INSE|nr:Hypothetical predicted protein [Cloeon dipterum]
MQSQDSQNNVNAGGQRQSSSMELNIACLPFYDLAESDSFSPVVTDSFFQQVFHNQMFEPGYAASSETAEVDTDFGPPPNNAQVDCSYTTCAQHTSDASGTDNNEPSMDQPKAKTRRRATEEEKETEKYKTAREKNNTAVKKSRIKKKQEVQNLQEQNELLQSENNDLRIKIGQYREFARSRNIPIENYS